MEKAALREETAIPFRSVEAEDFLALSLNLKVGSLQPGGT